MTSNQSKPSLGVFFTYGVSLGTWQKQGMLNRELTLYRQLLPAFHKIYFFTYRREDPILVEQLQSEGIFVCQKKIKCSHFFYSFLLPFLYRKELKECTVLKTNQMFGSWSGIIAKFLFSKRLIVRTGFTLSIFTKKKSRVKYYLARVIEKLACWFADALIVATLYEKEYFFRYKSKVFVIPNFVNTKLFFKKFYSRTSSGEKNILYIGRLTAQKNLENFLHALIGVDGVRFRIIGSGELQATLMDIVKQNNLPVEFLGNIPYLELPEYIHEADIFVLPSFYEGNPKVLLEAMGCGAAVLATKVSGIKEIVIHEKNGYLSDTNVESLHHALLAFLPNVQLQKFVGENAQQLIEKEYSIESVIEKELAVYRTLHIDI